MAKSTYIAPGRTPSAHGIDLTEPDGIARLLDFHRAAFGDARMEHEGDGDSGDGGDDDSSGDRASAGADGDEDDRDLGAKRALRAERAAAKAAKDEAAQLRARVQELEDAGKTEEQRREDATKTLQAEHTALQASVAAKDAQLLRYEIAAEKGLNLAAAKRLQGTTREEIEADAEDWKRVWGTGGAGEGTPPPDPGQGARRGHQQSSFAQGAALAEKRFGAQKQ